MTDLRNKENSSASSENTSSPEEPRAAPAGLFVLVERQSAKFLKALARRLDQPRETVASRLVLKWLDSPETTELFTASPSQVVDDGPASIPTTSEIYLASFQKESREELRLSFDSSDLQHIGALAAQHRIPPSRVAELILEAGLQMGSRALVVEDLQADPESSGGLLTRLLKKLGL